MGIVFGKITSETPPFALVRAFPAYELRRYEPQIAAVFSEPSAPNPSPTGAPPPTDALAANKAFSSRAFRALAGYYGIMGNVASTQQAAAADRPQESIAMTAPVVMRYAAADRMQSMTFLLPASKYSDAAAVPLPSDERVSVVEMPERTLAVRVFSGNLGLNAIERESAVLKEGMEADRIKAKGDVEVAGFNPPFSLPWMKTNQVMIEVEEKSVEGICKGDE